MADALAGLAAAYEGATGESLAELLGLPLVAVYDEIESTLDAAHRLGEAGASPGVLVLAERQTAGRGRLGRGWHSEWGRGIWLTLLERPSDHTAIDVLPLRAGMGAARVLDEYVDGVIGLKWPNDLYVQGRKLGGILVEARWRAQRLDWLAIGLGVNVLPPTGVLAANLRAGTSRLAVIQALVPALRAAAACQGTLTDNEVGEYAERDVAAGRRCRTPGEGIVRGIDRRGALVVDMAEGRREFRAGSLVFNDNDEGGA